MHLTIVCCRGGRAAAAISGCWSRAAPTRADSHRVAADGGVAATWLAAAGTSTVGCLLGRDPSGGRSWRACRTARLCGWRARRGFVVSVATRWRQVSCAGDSRRRTAIRLAVVGTPPMVNCVAPGGLRLVRWGRVYWGKLASGACAAASRRSRPVYRCWLSIRPRKAPRWCLGWCEIGLRRRCWCYCSCVGTSLVSVWCYAILALCSTLEWYYRWLVIFRAFYRVFHADIASVEEGSILSWCHLSHDTTWAVLPRYRCNTWKQCIIYVIAAEKHGTATEILFN